jgi:chromosomal replication initiator protein
VIETIEIKRAVCEHFGLQLTAMFSEDRYRAVARPRQIAMYLTRKLGGKSYPVIGRLYGGRDHTTVIHACRAVEKLADNDRVFERDVMALADRLTGVV